MPRNVRNFWIELDIDGRKHCIAAGPRSSDGGFEMTIKQRDEGSIMAALHVEGKASGSGKLVINVFGPHQVGDGLHGPHFSITTQR